MIEIQHEFYFLRPKVSIAVLMAMLFTRTTGSQVDDVEGLVCARKEDVEAELESSELSSSRRSTAFFLRP